MSFWSGQKLRQRLKTLIPDSDESRIDGAACVLRIGDEVYITPTARSGANAAPSIVHLKKSESFAIPPGQFGFLITQEKVVVPSSAMAMISFKTKMKWRGLVNVSGFHVDPGYAGRLVFAVYNAGPAPVHLRRGQDFFLIWYADLDNEASARDADRKKPGYENIDPSLVISGQISSFDTISERLRAVEDQQKYYQAVAAILISVALLMIGVLFRVPQLITGTGGTVSPHYVPVGGASASNRGELR
jgi:dCTP deaminase